MQRKSGWMIVLAICMISLTGCRAMRSEAGCEQYRTGKFLMLAEPDGIEFIVTRNDSVQTEHNLATGKISRMKVNWTSSCTYELILISTNEFISDSAQEYSKTHPLKVKIVKRTKEYYIFSAKMDGVDYTMRDTLRISL